MCVCILLCVCELGWSCVQRFKKRRGGDKRRQVCVVVVVKSEMKRRESREVRE